jgi:hypothetical protein
VLAISGVDVVGCDEGGLVRSCSAHEVCGKYVKVDDAIVFRGGDN